MTVLSGKGVVPGTDGGGAAVVCAGAVVVVVDGDGGTLVWPAVFVAFGCGKVVVGEGGAAPEAAGVEPGAGAVVLVEVGGGETVKGLWGMTSGATSPVAGAAVGARVAAGVVRGPGEAVRVGGTVVRGAGGAIVCCGEAAGGL